MPINNESKAGSRGAVTQALSCETCGKSFKLLESVRAKYPGWTPKQCMACRSGKTTPADTPSEAASRFSAGPQSGIFTDGSSDPNPGPGGWGAVKVIDGEIIEQRAGREGQTTNNRMELTALIEAFKMTAEDEEIIVFSDSQYCVKTVNEWAAGWEKRGWKRKDGPIVNLDLVQELFALARSRPRARVEWIRAHNGSRWNEYADALARAGQVER